MQTDFANIENSTYLYVLPGPNATCGNSDDVWKLVRLGMGASATPVMAKIAVSDIFESATGAISGWLVHDAGELQKCDANFSGCTTVTSVSSSVEWRLQASFDNILLDIDNQLYIYSETANTLSPSRFTIPSGTFNTVAETDGTTVYFGNENVLYQMPADGSANATVLQTEAAGVDIQRVTVGSNNVVYQVGTSGTGVEIKSVPKSGGTPVSLATATAGDDIFILYTKGSKVFYNIRTITVTPVYTIAPVVAGVVDEDGTNKVETANATWSGVTFKTTYNADETVNLEALLDKTFLIEGYDIGGTSGGFAGATVKVVDAATATVGATIGTLPATDNLFNFQCYGFGDDVLCSAVVASDPVPMPPALPLQNDIYFVNAATANSLTRTTNTTDEFETPLF